MKKLVLNRETIRNLQSDDLRMVFGGGDNDMIVKIPNTNVAACITTACVGSLVTCTCYEIIITNGCGYRTLEGDCG